jgi:hypothetical protein
MVGSIRSFFIEFPEVELLLKALARREGEDSAAVTAMICGEQRHEANSSHREK